MLEASVNAHDCKPATAHPADSIVQQPTGVTEQPDLQVTFQEHIEKRDQEMTYSISSVTPLNKVAIQDAAEVKEFMSPEEALRTYGQQLTSYEHEEIVAYPEIYYVGQRAESKKDFEWKYGLDVGQYFDDQHGVYQARKGDHIAYRYEITADLGQGSFACVLRAFDHKTKDLCAIKIVRSIDKSYKRLLSREIFILEYLNRQDVDNEQNIIHLLDHFWFREHQVMVFECLSLNLFDLNRKNDFQGFSRQVCRKFAKSILVALDSLYMNDIIHADMKPENILLKKKTRTGLKIIDFGWSHFISQKPFATYIQSRFYRAPEIILGGPYTTAIDVWSFGCILVELVTGYPIFPGDNKHDQISVIMEALGLPPIDFLKRCRLAGRYFSSEGYPFCCDIAVDRRENIVVLTGRHNKDGSYRCAPGTKPLIDTLCYHAGNKGLPIDDALIDLVQRCLTWDPAARIRPCEALLHNWITGLRVTNHVL